MGVHIVARAMHGWERHGAHVALVALDGCKARATRWQGRRMRRRHRRAGLATPSDGRWRTRQALRKHALPCEERQHLFRRVEARWGDARCSCFSASS